MKIKKMLSKKSFWMLALPIVTLFLIVESSPLVPEKPPITGELAKTARDNAKALADALAAQRSFIELRFDEQDILAIGAATSHLFDNINVAAGYSPSFVQMAASLKADLSLFSLYINGSCEIALNTTESYLNGCKLGDLPIPAFLAKPLMNAGIWLVFDNEVKNTANNMLEGLRFENRELVLMANKSIDLRQRVNESLSKASSVAKVALANEVPTADTIEIYLNELYKTDFTGQSLLTPIKQLSQLASVRSIDADAQQENAAMLWALAIRFGSPRFARIAKVPNTETELGVRIRGRDDLALHFLYSAILEQVGNEQLSFNIGELKEVLDSGSGGSGFSFVDLAADKAGIAFSKRLTESAQEAIYSQSLLANAKTERVFFPFTHDLPEGFSESSFARVFTSVSSEQYLKMSAEIDERIAHLKLHHSEPEQGNTAPQYSRVNTVKSGTWLKVDTHIHTKYSDGVFGVDEIAKQSASFGCDAIAITDHGDRNLSGVLSDDFFADVASANRRYNNMTVLAGLEWNIPPFNGREHATVLFGQTPRELEALAQFRRQYDQYRQRSVRHLDITQAMQWLDDFTKNAPTKPVLIYNHPSRKDFSLDENYFDLSRWLQLSDAFIGISGAPGHQAKRGKENGSYAGFWRTVNGFDRVANDIGGVWDELLQSGYRVLGARANSDFHNLKMDYWPCQFSTTHVFSRSNSAEDVIHALRAGRTWAQHGQFINDIDFNIEHGANTVYAGDFVELDESELVTLKLSITLNETDWEGYPASLDEVTLIMVQTSGTSTRYLLPLAKKVGSKIEVQMPMQLSSDFRAIRLQGRSIQSGLHDYQFITNPIFFREK